METFSEQFTPMEQRNVAAGFDSCEIAARLSTQSTAVRKRQEQAPCRLRRVRRTMTRHPRSWGRGVNLTTTRPGSCAPCGSICEIWIFTAAELPSVRAHRSDGEPHD